MVGIRPINFDKVQLHPSIILLKQGLTVIFNCRFKFPIAYFLSCTHRLKILTTPLIFFQMQQHLQLNCQLWLVEIMIGISSKELIRQLWDTHSLGYFKTRSKEDLKQNSNYFQQDLHKVRSYISGSAYILFQFLD